jgi:predicted GTPase
MHQKLFKNIKNDIPEVKTLNFIICGFSGAGKSTITNVILKGDLAKEGNDIHSVTQQFSQYSNPDKVPGLTIYDTIGVEPTNAKRNLDEIKKLIQDTFDQNLKDPQKSLHGILYCIKNGTDANRIEEGEIEFIKDLDKLNGNCDILTIIFTLSMNNKTQLRIKQLKEALNNDNIEIIPVIAKDYKLEMTNQIIPAYGLDKLIASIKKNAKKIVKANLKQIAKNKLKNEYIETTNTKYDDIKRKIKNQEFESTFSEECKVILENLIGNLDLKFDGLERVVSDSIGKLNDDVKKKFIDENQSNGLTKLYEEFGNLNTEYEGQIKDSSIKESFCVKLNKFYETKIIEEIRKVILESASLLFIEKSRDFLSEIISDNVKDEEVDDIANSTLDHILEKINKIK